MLPPAISIILACTSLFLCACNEQEHVEAEPPNLITVAEQGDLTKLLELLQQPHPMDVRDACHWTPLMKAALNGHDGAVQQLLDAGATPDLMDTGGYTALMLAAPNNHAEIVELLLSHGANVNQVEQTNGWTALIWASKRGHMATVKSLLALGADQTGKDSTGGDALQWATENRHQQVVALLSGTESGG